MDALEHLIVCALDHRDAIAPLYWTVAPLRGDTGKTSPHEWVDYPNRAIASGGVPGENQDEWSSSY